MEWSSEEIFLDAYECIQFEYTKDQVEDGGEDTAYVQIISVEPDPSGDEIRDSGACGPNLTWTLNCRGELHIEGTGPMDNYDFFEEAPWINYALSNEIYHIQIDEGVTTIGSYAFVVCDQVEQVWLPDSITSIGVGAFQQMTRLYSINIPGSVTYIGREAFWDSGLYLEASNWYDTMLVVNDCLIVASEGWGGDCFIPDWVSLIAEDAFSSSTCTALHVPISVTRFCENSLSSDNLTDLYYEGSQEQWNEVVPSRDYVGLNPNVELHFGGGSGEPGVEEYDLYTVSFRNYELPFIHDLSTDTYISTNQGVDDSISGMTLIAKEKVKVSFTYLVNSEAFQDMFTVQLNGETVCGPISGYDREDDEMFALNRGDVLTFEYSKDDSGSRYEDTAVISYLWVVDDSAIETPEDEEYDLYTVSFKDYRYPFLHDLEAGEYRSSNQDRNDTVSGMTLTAKEQITVSLNYLVSSEDGYDTFSILKNGEQICGPISGSNESGLVTACLEAGDVLAFEYEKDVSYSAYDDSAVIRGLTAVAGVSDPVVVDNGMCGDDLYWTLTSDGTLTITGSGPMYDYPDGSEGPGWLANKNIRKLVMESGATSIGVNAFYRCSNLVEAQIADTVLTIGESAIYGCHQLTELVIPNSVTQLGDYAVSWCKGLKKLTVGSGVTTIGNYAFGDNYSLTEAYFLGDAPTVVGEEIFAYVGYDFAIYYPSGASGWTTPEWKGYPAYPYDPAVHEHELVEDPGVEPTCTEDGLTVGWHCALCDYVIPQEPIPALGHDLGPWTEVTAPTCTAKGMEEKTCSRCDYRETRQIEARGHDMVTDPGMAPTCTEAGLTEGSHCTRCDYKTAQEPIPALGHDLVTDPGVAATCTASGLTEGSHCTRCDYKTAQKVIPALGHSYGPWTQTKAPTCTAKGEEKHTCTRCGDTQTRAVDALGHDLVTDPAVAATCTASGLTAGSHCTRCDRKTGGNVIPALGHRNTEIRDDVKPTCTQPGYTGDTWCLTCGTKVSGGEVLAATGHSWGEWVVTKPATDTEAGVKNHKCSVCGAVGTESIPKLPASFQDVKKGAFYYDSVYWAVEKNITAGTDAAHFSPDANCTRGQFVTFLWRAKGGEEVTSDKEFADVPASKYCAKAVAWAVEKDITTGATATTFAPDAKCTRAQVVTFLARAYNG